MIFLTVGTQLPFDRMVRVADEWAARNPEAGLFGQIADPGPKGYRPKHFEWVEDLDPAAFQAKFDAARIVIAHAGMGTIISALLQGKPLLIVPRRAHLGEHRNDHQYATAGKFRDKPGILVAEEMADFTAGMARLSTLETGAGAAISPVAQPALTGAIRKAIGL